jgi:Na+/proline symporter
MVSSNILIALFAVFFGVVTSLIFLFARGYGKSKDGFFVSFRNIGFLLAAISAAMAWTNSPAFFISFFQSYTNGLTGLFWFSFGNIITLMVYSFGAQKVRAVIPQGYTFSEFMGKLHGQRLQKVYMFCLSLVAVLTLCTGLITLTKTLSIVIGVNQLLITAVVMASVFLLSFRVGLRATLYAEVIKFASIIGLYGFIFLAFVFYNHSGINPAGITQHGLQFSWNMFVTFGLITFLGQMAAPWIDNSFAQRALSIEEDKSVQKTFITSGFLFAIPVLLSGIMGFIAAATPISVPKGQEAFSIIYAIKDMLGYNFLVLFLFVVIASLIGILDSYLYNISSFIGNDIAKMRGWTEKKSLFMTRLGLVLISIFCVVFVNLSFINLIFVFLLTQCVRMCLGLTSAGLTLKPEWFDGNRTAYVILAALALCCTGFFIGEIYQIKYYALVLAIVFGLLTPVLCIVMSRPKLS